METTKSKTVLNNPSHNIMIKRDKKRQLCFFIASLFLTVIGISSLTATTAILLTRDTTTSSVSTTPECFYEEDDSKVQSLFKTIKTAFYKIHPENHHPRDSNSDRNQRYLAPFNFTPEMYRHETETAKLLLNKLKNLEEELSEGSGTASEEQHHTFKLFKYFLLNTFGQPYENNYFAGDWLTGPNIFCWQRSCWLLGTLGASMDKFVPLNSLDIEKVIKLMITYGEMFYQRIRNLRYGIEVGIVPPEEACRVGVESFKLSHIHVAKHGEQGIFRTDVAKKILNPKFLENITEPERLKWRQKYNVSIQKSLNTSILNNLGKPLKELIRYLEDDYLSHCPPSNVSSGYASLPIPYVYTNGVPDRSKPTNGTLPGGEKFNGSDAYLILLSFFATYNITPKHIDELADRRIKELYPQVVQIAKNITKEKNATAAIKKFKQKLESQEFYYAAKNDSNHSHEQHLACNNAENAKKYCPERWQAMNNWLQSARAILSQLRTKINSAFNLTGKKQIVPLCPLGIEFDFNPATSYYSYWEGTKDCKSLAKVNIPFFLDRMGPTYEERTVLAHESYPGHHLEVQGVREHFQFKCEEIANWVSQVNYYGAFSEGWATYVEKHVADKDMELYKDDIMSKYGMLKHQILATLRAKVDVGLHFMGLKRHEAIALYEKYAWESADVSNKQITRLQSTPGQGSSYLVGEEILSELRKEAEDILLNKFDVKEFHYQVLAKGPLPMTYLSTRVREYIRELNDSK